MVGIFYRHTLQYKPSVARRALPRQFPFAQHFKVVVSGVRADDLAIPGVVGVVWITGLGLGFTYPVGTGGVLGCGYGLGTGYGSGGWCLL